MSEPRERPLLFSAPMVQAILAGRKTQTRRLAKPRRRASVLAVEGDEQVWADSYITDPGNRDWLLDDAAMRPGDTLWVREAWRVGAKNDAIAPRDLDHPRGMTIAYEAGGSRAHETVGGPYVNSAESFTTADWIGRLRASMHMPRWASRITLRCTDVRVERLNDCSEADAIAEGVHRIGEEYESFKDPESSWHNGPNLWTVNMEGGSLNSPTATGAYEMLWDHINGPGAWAKNPLVWVYSFEKVEG